jgi:O-antigen/teichoic acid export membrane protein
MFVAFQLRGVVASDLNNEFTNREYFGFRLITLAVGLLLAMAIAVSATHSGGQIVMVGIVGLIQAAELTSDTLYGFHQSRGDLVRPATSMILKGLIGLVALIFGIYSVHSVLAGLTALFATRAAVLVLYDLKGALAPLGRPHSLWRDYFHWRRHFHLIKVVFFVGLMTMLSALIGMIPRYFVQGYLGSRELGVFAAISSLISVGLMPVGALGMAAFVRLARGFTEGPSADFIKILSVLLGLSLAIGIVGVTLAYLAGSQILTMLFRHEYAAYTDLLKLTMINGAITFLTASLGASVTAARIFKPQVGILAIVGGTEVLACWVLVPRMGLTGAAVACLIGALVQLIGTALILCMRWTQPVPAARAANVATFGSNS